ncbi:hypothetical protein [Microbacterium capsulatum]|uniref:Uncharacterized protein n=1 Tax=Microbacterium capsulatum TaxID=3041921 RepID=A0ABU0XGG3_9MICO|nr:hypothetical protein [Microbacterium sp. ASV81]MDQ4213270.1 hypothetical protein [Microbacterium sp. ASV81]
MVAHVAGTPTVAGGVVTLVCSCGTGWAAPGFDLTSANVQQMQATLADHVRFPDRGRPGQIA